MGSTVGLRFNPPPGWPPVPEGFVPPPGWQPHPNTFNLRIGWDGDRQHDQGERSPGFLPFRWIGGLGWVAVAGLACTGW